MLHHYFLVAWRNLRRNKSFSMINIGGLAIGMTVAILIGLWIHSEYQYDRIFKNYDRIAQILRQETIEGKIEVDEGNPIPFKTLLQTKYSQYFKHIIISSYPGAHILNHGETNLSFGGVYMDKGADDMLSLKMRYGHYGSLEDPHAILISQTVAKAFFGNKNPVGQSLKIDKEQEVKITGVYEDIAKSSSFSGQDFIAPWSLCVSSNDWIQKAQDKWNNCSFLLYTQLADNQSWDNIEKVLGSALSVIAIPKLIEHKTTIRLLPMRDWHLRNQFENGVQKGGRIDQVRLFASIGILVLLIACINFMNLSTARSEKRAKEVGIRKAVGSARKQLIWQFYFEALLISFAAALLSLGLVWLTLPWFNQLYETTIAIPWLNMAFWLLFLGFILLTTLIAGSYPAIYLSSFNAIAALKGKFKVGKHSITSRKVLIVGQFTVSLVLIIATSIIYKQIKYSEKRNMGYDKDQLIAINMKTSDYYGKYDLIRNELLSNRAIQDMTESSSPLTAVWSTSDDFFWEGKDPNLAQQFGTLRINYNFGNTVGWQIKEGRGFSKDQPGDSTSVVLNEAAVKYMGLRHPIGSIIRWGEGTNAGSFQVIGVIKDMVMESPYEPTRQMMFFLDPENVNWMILRLNASMGIKNALEKIQTTFKKVIPQVPFEYNFVDQNYAEKFSAENKIGTLAGLFATMAIFICCIGLFGLASFMAEQRIKEIGIRKVLGASMAQLWLLLSKNFMYLILISSAIALPTGWYAMHLWLQKYPYRTSVSGWLLILPALFALAIALLTVSWHAIRAAKANPIKSLKTE